MEQAVHDRGGWPTDAPIDRSEHELADWELLTDAIVGALGAARRDERRRAAARHREHAAGGVRARVVLRALALLGRDDPHREGRPRSRRGRPRGSARELPRRPASARRGASARWPSPYARLHQGQERPRRARPRVVHEPGDACVRERRAPGAAAVPRRLRAATTSGPTTRGQATTGSTSTSSSTGWRRQSERPRPRSSARARRRPTSRRPPRGPGRSRSCSSRRA